MCMMRVMGMLDEKTPDNAVLEDALAHAGEMVDEKMAAYAETLRQHYIWLYKEDRRAPRMVYCSACGGRWEAAAQPLARVEDKRMDRGLYACPGCGEMLPLKEAWRGRKHMQKQRSSVGWKATKCAERLVEEYMVRIESLSTFSDKADAN